MATLASFKAKAYEALGTAHADVVNYVHELEAEVTKNSVLPWVALAVGVVIGFLVGHYTHVP